MEITKDEARIVLALADIAWQEGRGSEGDIEFVKKVQSQFPDLPEIWTDEHDGRRR